MPSGFEPGDLILESQAFVYVVSDKMRGKRCDFCLKGTSTLKKCTQCKAFYFCDRSCQRRAWKDIHREECILVKGINKAPTEFFTLTARIILKLQKKRWDEEYEKVFDRKRTFDSLVSHLTELQESKEMMGKFFQLNCMLQYFFHGSSHLLPSTNQLLSIFGKLTVNGFGIYDEEVVSIGSGLYLGASILDHSCDPNAVSTFTGTTIYVRAVKHVPSQDVASVSISYIDQIQKTSLRKDELWQQYFFDCNCPWCAQKVMDDLMVEESSNFSCEDKLTHLLEDLKQAAETGENLLCLFEETVSLLRSSSLGPYHVLRSQVLNSLFDSAISLQRWEDAVAFGQESIPPLRHYLGNYHPSIGVLLLKIGKLQLYLERVNEARISLEQAKDILGVTHGKDRDIYGTLKELLHSSRYAPNLSNALSDRRSL